MAEEEKRLDYVSVSADVLLSKDLTWPIKGFYGSLVAFAGKDGVGHLTEEKLSELTMLDPKTVRRYMLRLTRAGLVQLEKRSHYLIVDPVVAYYAVRLHDVQHRLRHALFIGEALMREWLTLLVAVLNFQDNARVSKIINPKTREYLELDRFFPPDVAFEFNGPQHYGPTAKFPDPAAAADQELRDIIKIGQCKRYGIELVIVTTEDLSLEGMLRKIGNLLPLRPGAAESPAAAFLEKESRRYRKRWFD